MIRRPALAGLFAALVLAPGLAAAQAVPSATGDVTAAPRTTARSGRTIETADAARDKARMHTHTGTHIRTAGTASSGAGGPDAPPPTMPVGGGTAPSPQLDDASGLAFKDAAFVHA